MNTLIVPTIEQPDLSEKSLREILLKEGVEVHVNTVNWSEYSYLLEVKLS